MGQNLRSIGIFFLNTKADVLTIRKDAEDDDEDEDEDNDSTEDRLLNREREKRYKLLLNVSEFSSTISDGEHPVLDKCDCFDIFSSQGSSDAMENKIKQHAINKTIHFAAEHDLRSTKRIIKIVLGAIDDFFDFVLITNRRSHKDWEKIRDYALEWIDEYFAEYQSKIEDIVKEAEKALPIKLDQVSQEIEKRALPHCETRWLERIYLESYVSSISALASSPAIEYINMTVESEVIKPVLREITSKISLNTNEKVGKTKTSVQSTKNELLMAAYRTVMIDSAEYGSFYSRSSLGSARIIGLIVIAPVVLLTASLNFLTEGLVSFILKNHQISANYKIRKVEEQRKEELRLHLLKLKENMGAMSVTIKNNMQKWLENSRGEFIRKVDCYYKLVIDTLDQRQEAYDLAREFAPAFARVECCLVAKLDLVKHQGSSLTIQNDILLGMGGYFTIHPSTWGLENNLVVKKLIHATEDRDVAYIEAHFHRTITRLQIPYIVPLCYLYETAQDLEEIVIVLPRYIQKVFILI